MPTLIRPLGSIEMGPRWWGSLCHTTWVAFNTTGAWCVSAGVSQYMVHNPWYEPGLSPVTNAYSSQDIPLLCTLDVLLMRPDSCVDTWIWILLDIYCWWILMGVAHCMYDISCVTMDREYMIYVWFYYCYRLDGNGWMQFWNVKAVIMKAKYLKTCQYDSFEHLMRW